MATRAMLRAAPVRVRVPATCANLGPGFDALALSISLYDDIGVQVRDTAGLEVDVHGEEADTLPRTKRHLVVKSIYAGLTALGAKPRGLAVVCANRIPHGRGLGSSAAAIIGGLVAARGMVVGGEERLPDRELLELATSLEGHRDNVTACLYGGLTIASDAEVVRLEVRAPIAAIVCVPTAAKVSTARARALLPDLVPLRSAAANIARTALLVQALTGPQPELLLEATRDELHQGARRPAYPRSMALVDKLRDAGFAAVISGSGPTVLVLADPDAQAVVAGLVGARFDVATHPLDTAGATIL